jgi:tRNA G18 (ribose-2'-O)-methylase SpoU
MELDAYRDLRDRDLRREGLLVAEGRWLAERLLASGWEVLSVLCAPRFAAHFRELAAGRCPVLTADEEQLARLAGFPFHRGVLAAARRPKFLSLAAWLAEPGSPGGSAGGQGSVSQPWPPDRPAGKPPPAPLVVCPQLTGEYNLGSIVRSAAALGAGALAVGPRCCDPLSRRALKVSMGAAFRLPLLALSEEAAADLARLRAAGYRIAGASPAPEALPLAAWRHEGPVALVLGEEAEGLPEPWAAGCDVLLRIPMREGADSLNVSVAAGILLHALCQPRAL